MTYESFCRAFFRVRIFNPTKALYMVFAFETTLVSTIIMKPACSRQGDYQKS